MTDNRLITYGPIRFRISILALAVILSFIGGVTVKSAMITELGLCRISKPFVPEKE